MRKVMVWLLVGDGSEWARAGTDWPMDQQQLSRQIEQYKKERQRKQQLHDNFQRPRKHDLKAMIATLGAGEDEQTDDIAAASSEGKHRVRSDCSSL